MSKAQFSDEAISSMVEYIGEEPAPVVMDVDLSKVDPKLREQLMDVLMNGGAR